MLVRFYHLVCFWKKRCMKVAWNCLVSVWKLCAHKAQKCCVRIGAFRLLGIALPLGAWYTKNAENIDVSRLSACFWKFFFRLPNDDATHHRQLGVKRPWVQVSPLGPSPFAIIDTMTAKGAFFLPPLSQKRRKINSFARLPAYAASEDGLFYLLWPLSGRLLSYIVFFLGNR